MKLAEVDALLQLAQMVDNRNYDEQTVLVWQGILGDDVTYEDCKTALLHHFRDRPDVYLNPGHVRQGALELDRARRRAVRELREAEQKAIESGRSTERSEATNQLIAKVREQLGAGDPDVFRRGEWLEWERTQQRAYRARTEPNPEFRGYPPPKGWPVPTGNNDDGEAA